VKPRRTFRVAAIAIDAVVLACGVAAFAWRARHRPVVAEAADPAPAATKSDVAPAASASAPQTSDAPAPATARPATRPTPRAAEAGRRKKDCDPPYWIDARGKHFKDQCL
jgi:hypothetical protein